MGAFKNPSFVAEFFYRTQWNYFKLRSLQETDSKKVSYINQKIRDLEHEMRIKGYEITDYYEVTQLINSLIGLLVFPEQTAYEHLSKNPEDLKRLLPLLNEYVNDKPGNFTNTYREYNKDKSFAARPEESKSPRNIIRHLRNAAAHKKIGIYPVNGELVKGRREIKEIVFKDERGSEGEKQYFELKISVEDLEPLLLEIGNVLLKAI